MYQGARYLLKHEIKNDKKTIPKDMDDRKFWNILLGHSIKHKSIICEERGI